jgi:hypothetical protein
MRHLLPEFTVVSVYQLDEDRLTNLENHQKVISYLKENNITHLEAVGSYKGNEERSIVIFGSESKFTADMIAGYYCQESYLYCDQDRNASLVFEGEKFLELGTWKEISSEDTKSLEAWTKIPSTGKYYACG